MSRTLGILCAGACLLASAGCTLDSFFLSFTGSTNHQEQAVTLSADQVSASLHTTLSMRFPDVKFEDSRNGEELHIKGVTKTGKKFEFIVQKQKTSFGDRTLVVFEGDKEAEALLWLAATRAIIDPTPVQQPTVLPVGGAVPDSHVPLDRVHGGMQ